MASPNSSLNDMMDTNKQSEIECLKFSVIEYQTQLQIAEKALLESKRVQSACYNYSMDLNDKQEAIIRDLRNRNSANLKNYQESQFFKNQLLHAAANNEILFEKARKLELGLNYFKRKSGKYYHDIEYYKQHLYLLQKELKKEKNENSVIHTLHRKDKQFISKIISNKQRNITMKRAQIRPNEYQEEIGSEQINLEEKTNQNLPGQRIITDKRLRFGNGSIQNDSAKTLPENIQEVSPSKTHFPFE